MIPNNNLNILPFYTSLDDQNHRKIYAYGDVYNLIAPNNKLLPFQINREHSYGELYSLLNYSTTTTALFGSYDVQDKQGENLDFKFKAQYTGDFAVYGIREDTSFYVLQQFTTQDFSSQVSFSLTIPSDVVELKFRTWQSGVVIDYIRISGSIYGESISSIKAISLDGSETEILDEFLPNLSVKTFNDYDLLINNSVFIFPTLVLPAGKYYIKIEDSLNTWYSEVFTVVDDLSQYLKLEYWDSDSIAYSGGHIDYNNPFKNYCYLQTEIGKPEYPFEEEAQQRDGYIFIEKQISEKKYKFEFLAPEYLCDALRIVRMHDFINIYFRGKKYSVENIIFDPKWREQGNLAVMEVEFECDTIIKKIGRGIIPSGNGDFNNDYNSDYDN